MGDLDGDGLGDVAVTVFPDVLRGWSESCWTGDVLLYTDPGPGDRVPSEADGTLLSLGEASGWDGTLCQRAGTSVASLGDMDGDGRSDLAVGAPEFWVGKSWIYRNALPGRVYVWTGPVDGTRELKESTAIIEGDEEVQNVGLHVTGPGDVDGDGQPDLLTGALLYQGPLEGALGVGDARARFIDPGRYGQWEWTPMDLPSAAADVDGDGRADLLLGYPDYVDEGGDRVGAALLFYGR